MTSSPTATSPRSSWYALLILFLINGMNFYDRQIIGAVAEPIRKEWMLSDTQLGTLGTAFILMYAIVGLPFGRLADKFNRKRILGFGVMAWSALTALSGIAANFGGLFASRLGVGIGEASCAPAANSMIGDLFPARQRAMALSLFMLGLPLGLFFSYRISGWIAQNFSWREAFYFAGVPGLLLGLLAFTIKEPARGATEIVSHAALQRPGSPYLVVLGIPTMAWIIVSGALHNFNAYAVNAFLPAFLMRVHHMGIKEASNISSIVLGVVGIGGLLAGGFLADYWSRFRKDGKLLFTAVCALVAAPLLYIALLQAPGRTFSFMMLMGIGYMLVYVYYACVYASIQDVIEPSLRGTAMAMYFFAMYLLGGSMGPVLTGVASDYFARKAMTTAGATVMNETFKAEGLHSAMFMIPIVCALLGLVLFAASRTVVKDMNRLTEWQKTRG